MSWGNRVAWQEGMFLRAQHFQQQDRWLEGFVRGRTSALRPHGWGVTELSINKELLATGQFALSAASGVFEDGTPFALPGEADHPPPLALPDGTRNALVYLAIPVRQPGAVEMGTPTDTEGRYVLRDFEAYDTHSASPQPAELQVGQLRLRYMLATEDRAGYLCIGLARVTEVGADRRVSLDDRWIAPALVCAAVSPLGSLVVELAGILNQRGEALAARLTQPGARAASEVSDFLMLQSINRWQKLLNHWADSGNVHPLDLYATLVQMAGDFATFVEASRRPSAYPAYRHDDLQRSFAPVVADLRRYFAQVIASNAVQIPLVTKRFGVRVGAITDRGVLRSSQFVLIVQADKPAETVRRLFPPQVKIGAAEHIQELVNVQLPGIEVQFMPAAPREIPFYAGAHYFELDRNSAHWQQMQSSGAFAIHAAGEWPNLNLELWAIRDSGGEGRR